MLLRVTIPSLSILLSTCLLNADLVEIGSVEQFNTLKGGSKPLVVKFAADWCGACKSVKDAYREVAALDQFNHVTFAEIDVEKIPEIGVEFEVQGIPTIAFVHNGQVLGKEVGVENKETFKEILSNKISSLFASTPTNGQIGKQAVPATTPEATGDEQCGGIVCMIKAGIMWTINSLHALFNFIVNTIKGFFGK